MENGRNVQQIITEQFRGSAFRFTPRDLLKRVKKQHPGLSPTQIHSAIKKLVQRGILTYSHRFNSTQLEINYQRCVGVTSKIALCPEIAEPAALHSKVIIRLRCGEAFGLGDHPTTRLALRGIEIALDDLAAALKTAEINALDIGTGSGVLALAAAKLGVGWVCAMDNDAVARYEARANADLNGLSSKVLVVSTPLEEMPDETYALITANLRPPTLRALFSRMARVARAPSNWVLSGFRPEEGKALLDYLEKMGASIFWWEKESGWAAMVVRLNSQALGVIYKGD